MIDQTVFLEQHSEAMDKIINFWKTEFREERKKNRILERKNMMLKAEIMNISGELDDVKEEAREYRNREFDEYTRISKSY